MKVIPIDIKSNNSEKKSKKNISLKEKKEDNIQFDLGLKESPLNKFYSVRHKLDKLEDRLRQSQYWRNPMVWVIIFVPFLIAATYTKIYLTIQNRLPDNVPILLLNNDLTSIFLPKISLILIPLTVGLLSLVVSSLFRISYRRSEKYIFISMMLTITLSIISFIEVSKVMNLFI